MQYVQKLCNALILWYHLTQHLNKGDPHVCINFKHIITVYTDVNV